MRKKFAFFFFRLPPTNKWAIHEPSRTEISLKRIGKQMGWKNHFVAFFKYSWFTMLYQFMLDPKVTQSHTQIYIHSFSLIIFHRVPPQVIGYTSLCYTAEPHCLSILNIIVCIYSPQTPSPSTSSPLPLGNHKSVFYVCESVSLFLFYR